jgi:hypothetical protein
MSGVSLVFRIRDILWRIRNLGYGYTHWLTGPDPALFFIYFYDAKKSRFFLRLFAYYLL